MRGASVLGTKYRVTRQALRIPKFPADLSDFCRTCAALGGIYLGMLHR